MKKGFTLVELLIVMVIVGTLVTIALPKYQAALERGRAQEAFTNLKTASDIINAQYVLNGNTYGEGDYSSLAAVVSSTGDFLATEKEKFTKPHLFSEPKMQQPPAGGSVSIFSTREGEYTLIAVSEEGELKEFQCQQSDWDENYCLNIGMEDAGDGVYKMDLTDF